MPIHGKFASFASPIIRSFVRRQAGNLYTVLRYQDRIIDKTYRKAGLYNRGLVKGIQHGLAGGQIIGGSLQLGLNAPDTPGNDAVQTPRNGFTSDKSYKTRGGQTGKYDSRYKSYRRPYCIKRRSSPSKRY